MTDTNNQNIVQKLQNKLSVVSSVLKLGHECFQQNDLFLTAAYITNNSRLVIPATRSAVIDVRVSPELIAVSGQATTNKHSEYSLELLPLVRVLSDLKQATVITPEFLKAKRAGKRANKALEYFLTTPKKQMLVVPLPNPTETNINNSGFLWIIEVEHDAKELLPLVTLLAKHYAEALWFHCKSEQRTIKKLWHGTTWKKRLLIAALILLPTLFLVRMNQDVKAEFEIIPTNRDSYFAPFAGIIDRCYFRDGQQLKAGTPVLKYETEQLELRLAKAENSYGRSKSEYDRILNQSFAEKQYLGQLEMLKLACEQAKLDIAENKWLLKQSTMKARESGTISIYDAAQLDGKAVQSGEKLFEVLSNDNLSALVLLNEKDASVLGDKAPKITLFLHTNPEKPMQGKISSISPKPVLTELRNYCYRIKLALPQEYQTNLRCGMRGIARVSGGKVSLGYYLFRNLVLWWRQV